MSCATSARIRAKSLPGVGLSNCWFAFCLNTKAAAPSPTSQQRVMTWSCAKSCASLVILDIRLCSVSLCLLWPGGTEMPMKHAPFFSMSMQKLQIIFPVPRHFVVHMHYAGGTHGFRTKKRPWNQRPWVTPFVSHAGDVKAQEVLYQGTEQQREKWASTKLLGWSLKPHLPPLPKTSHLFFSHLFSYFSCLCSHSFAWTLLTSSLSKSRAACLPLLCLSLRHGQNLRTRKGSLTINYNKYRVHPALTSIPVLTGCKTTVKS